MKEIAKQEYYRMAVDESKNRFYLTLSGFWKDTSLVPNYISDIKKSVASLKPGFTIVSDLRAMKTPPQDVGEKHKEAQSILVAAGLKKTAEILTGAVLKMALSNYSQASQMAKQSFGSIEEAEKWLDS